MDAPPQQGYAGVAFDFGGNTHYGWFDITVTSVNAAIGTGSFSATLNSYAWENSAGQAIAAGDTGPAAMPVPPLAGVVGMAAVAIMLQHRRNRRRSAKTSEI